MGSHASWPALPGGVCRLRGAQRDDRTDVTLGRASADPRHRRYALPGGFRIYFNLAAQMLDDIPFIAELGETLAQDPGLVDHLGIEVTETAAMQNVERSKNTIDLLRRWGFAVAIDDFGTGYSSLSYLKKLTVDMIKVDQSFIAGLPDDEQDCALAEMLLRITDRFGFTTLAEGIETEAQVRWLIEQGCRFGQGYLLGRPAPFADLVQRLAEGGRLTSNAADCCVSAAAAPTFRRPFRDETRTSRHRAGARCVRRRVARPSRSWSVTSAPAASRAR